MKNWRRLLCLALAVLCTTLTACVIGPENQPPESIRPQTVRPNASGEITWGDQTFSVDEERLTVNLQVRSNEILDLSPLALCTGLQSLSVHVTVIPHIYYDIYGDPQLAKMEPTDLSPLAGLSNLERLELNVGEISDLAVLTGLQNLNTLVLWIEGSVDLVPLTGCGALESLSLGGRGTVDLTPLKRCTSLKNLRVDIYDENWNGPDLSKLSGAPALEVLSVGASNGLSRLVDVPLKRLVDINDSGNILTELPVLAALEYVEFSDEHLNDILPLLRLSGLKEISLEVGAQEIENFTVISSSADPLLDSLITVIPVDQLRRLMDQTGATITIVVDSNRTAGVME